MDIPYSEIFLSIQGEGERTGYPSVWIRLFGCNLNCDGFGQDDPTDESSWDLPYEKIDVSDITKIEDLPVFNKGCDSSYSWSSRFTHLQKRKTPQEIVDEFESLMRGTKWDAFDLCFTGGEPLLPRNQTYVLAILEEIMRRTESADNMPNVTFETNGTRHMIPALHNFLVDEYITTTFSISPKLFNVSGERDAISVDGLCSMINDIEKIPFADWYFKFVVDTKPASLTEMENVVDNLCKVYDMDEVTSRVWLMPLGATEESQRDIAADVAEYTLFRGYKFSARLHNYLWGNEIGR